MANSVDRPEINADECTGCADCIPACPTEALSMNGSKVIVSADAECSYCGECEEVCPTGAIICPYEIEFADETPQ
ncbi:MAG: 4Fe-4S binding protein [Chloroflexi bacterium]|nr:4Fe-4S binding protein [Chloroflexota bacterium]